MGAPGYPATQMITPHPDFAGQPPPRSAAFGPFTLSVLSPEITEEDFAAVTSSAAVLQGLFGDNWPRGLTLEDNRADLARHLAEFDGDAAFAWVIRSVEGEYLGCAYLYPDAGGRGRIYTWVVDRPDRLDILADFNARFANWLDAFLPDGFALSWTTNDTPG